MHVRLLPLLLLALVYPSAIEAADAKPKKAASEVFGLDKVWDMHLTISAENWKKMPPTRGGFGMPGFGQPPAKPPEKGADRKPRGMFGHDFEYVKAELVIDGKTFKDVAVRFKGNGTYVTSQNGLKRPFKIDLGRYVDGQTFKGQKKLTLNNHAMDPTAARDALSYAVYRSLDVPAPRTAFVRLTITVPGKYDKEFVGLYTLAESIDKTFLQDRFGSSKGLLLKPERGGALDYRGEKWSAYEGPVGPKHESGKKAQRRFIEFTKLINQGTDKEFAKQIGKYLDVDEFLRFMAATVALSSMDSFIGLGHNYLIYLDPKSNKFQFIPWDLDLAFGAFFPLGSGDQLMNLSIRRPFTGRNRLIERLFADAKTSAQYKGHLKKLLAEGFTEEGIKKDLAAIKKAIAPALEKEKKAVAARKENRGGFGPGAGMFNNAPAIETFVVKRSESITAQLAGKRKGIILGGGGFGMGGPGGFRPGQMLIRPIFDAADNNDDDRLTKEEVTAAIKALFKAIDKEKKGEVDEKTLAAALDKVVPRQGGFGGFGGQAQGAPWAKVIMARAGKDGKLTEEGFLAAALKLFTEFDKDKDGKLNEDEVGNALAKIAPAPSFGPPGGFRPGQFFVRPVLDAADKNKDGKLSKAEATAAAKALFKALDKDKKGEIDEKTIAAGLDKILPGFGGFRPPGQGAPWAKVMMEKAGKDGKVTEARLVAALLAIFAECDKNKDGVLNEDELIDAIGKVMPMPRFGPPPGGPPPGGPRPQPKKDDRERKEGGK